MKRRTAASLQFDSYANHVVEHEMRHSLLENARGVEARQEVAGHSSPDRLVAVEVPVGERVRLAHVMEQRCQPNHLSVWGRVNSAQGVIPQILAADLVLAQPALSGEVWSDNRQQARVGHQRQSDGRPPGREQLQELGADALARKAARQLGVATDRRERLGFDLELQRGRQPDGSGHSQRVLAEPLVRIADRPQETAGQVVSAAVGVDEGGFLARPPAPCHRVHGEVASGQVLFDRVAKLH